MPTTSDFFDKWHRFSTWLWEHSVDLAIAGGVAVAAILVMIGMRGLCRRALGGEHATGWRRVIEKVVARTGLFFIVMVAAKLVSIQVDLPGRAVDAIDILFVIAAALQAAIWVRTLIIGSIEMRVGAAEHHTLGTAMDLIRVFVTIAAFLIATIVILDNVGVNITGLVAGLGVGGIAIGLAAQGIFKDLFAALSIIFDKPFRKGDTISFGGKDGVTGTVENIGLRTTRLVALDGEQIAVGNDKLVSDRIHNYALQQRRRAILTYSAAPHASAEQLARLTAAIEPIVSARPDATFDRAGLIRVGIASADLEIVFYMETADFGKFAATRHAILLEVQRKADEFGIAPPAPAPVGTGLASA